MRKALLIVLVLIVVAVATMSQSSPSSAYAASAAASAPAQDLVDNTQYQNWAKFKVGAMQKISMSSTVKTEEQEMVSTGTMTSTLKELTAEKAVVEVVMTMTSAGRTVNVPAQKMEIKAKVPPEAASQPAGLTPPKDAKVTRLGEGDEEITVGDKKYKCHWEKWQIDMKGEKGTVKVWNCKDIPGGMVKVELESSAEDPVIKKSSKMELLEFKDGN